MKGWSTSLARDVAFYCSELADVFRLIASPWRQDQGSTSRHATDDAVAMCVDRYCRAMILAYPALQQANVQQPADSDIKSDAKDGGVPTTHQRLC